MNSGYFHQTYAHSNRDNTQTIFLEKSKGWLQKQKIPKFNLYDAKNCYPLFCCPDWDFLLSDIDKISDDIISVCIVSDPFAKFENEKFNEFFDIYKEFKQHYIVDFNLKKNYSPHHEREVKRALNKNIIITRCIRPLDYLNIWFDLYAKLIHKHNINNDNQFTVNHFANQFIVPGFFAFIAEVENEIIGMALWYVSKGNAYYHLTAYSDLGYKTGASYALMNHSLSYFKNIGVNQVTLGAGAGLTQSKIDGLSKFKSGWSNYTSPVYFCGKINNVFEYNNLLNQAEIKSSSFFPAYRQAN